MGRAWIQFGRAAPGVMVWMLAMVFAMPARAGIGPELPGTATQTSPAAAPAPAATAQPAIERRSLGTPQIPNAKPAAAAVRASGADASGGILGPGSWTRSAAALGAVLLLIVLLMRGVRAIGGKAGIAGAIGGGGRAPSGVLEVLGRFPLARGQSLVLLRLDRRVLLCCHTRGGKFGAGGGMSALCEISDPDEVASLLMRTRDQNSESLSTRFQAILRGSEQVADRRLADAVAPAASALPKGEAGRRAVYGLDHARRVAHDPAKHAASAVMISDARSATVSDRPSGAEAAVAIRRRLAALRAGGITA